MFTKISRYKVFHFYVFVIGLYNCAFAIKKIIGWVELLKNYQMPAIVQEESDLRLNFQCNVNLFGI